MRTLEIRAKKLTGNTAQYIYFRQENSRIFQYLNTFPYLSRNPGVRYHKTWEYPEYILSRISYNVEPHSRAFAYLSMPLKINAPQVPGIVAIHPEYWGLRTGKSVTVGFVDELETGITEPARPPKRPSLSQHMKAFSYARELCERGFIVLSPDLPGFEDYAKDDRLEQDWETQASGRYLLAGSTLMAKTLHDLYGAVSALSSIEGVDDSAIGVIGYGLGGEFSVMLGAFDRRINAVIAGSGSFSYASVENDSYRMPQHRVIPGFRAHDRDFDFFIDLVSPVPMLIMYVPSPDERRIIRKRRENQETILLEKPGSFPPSLRTRAYGFLERELWTYRRNLYSGEIE